MTTEGFKAEAYLGDGLYAEFDGYMFKLRAPRENGDHWVGLEPVTLIEFLRFCKRCGIEVKL